MDLIMILMGVGLLASLGLGYYYIRKLGETDREFREGYEEGLTGEHCDSCHWYHVEGYHQGRNARRKRAEKTDHEY